MTDSLLKGKGEVKARVSNVFSDRRPYAVAQVIDMSVSVAVTFSLDSNRQVWKETEYPMVGTVVILSDLRKNDRGWRAYKARFLRLDDEVEQ